MDTISTVLLFVGLLVRVSIAVKSSSLELVDPSMASIVVKEGESAEISCTMKESNVAYFWKKGGSLKNSTDVASFIKGITTINPDQSYAATENGTLIIKKVSRNDEGKYICRLTSAEISCHGEVIVFVQAALQDFQLTIKYCEPENSCVISTESTKPTSLTCKAINASPSMKLKWFNGSREIKDNIEESSLAKETSREISSTIKDVYKAPSTLTCQAVDFKTSNDDGMFAHVQFRTPASTADISSGWIVTAILFIVGFVILFLIIISITVWPKIRKGKDVETQNSAERESLLSKDKELQDKREQISKLENNIQTKDDELKTKTEEINELNKALSETKAAQRVDETKVTSKDKELQDKQEQISKLEKSLDTVTGKLLKTNEEHQKTATTQQRNLESKLVTQKDSLNKKDLEIQQLRSNLEHVEKELTKKQNREQEISSKEAELNEMENKIKGREFEMNSIESKLKDREINVKRREDDMNLKGKTLTERETNLKIREVNMDLTEKGLRESEDNVKRREEQLNSRDSSLRIQATNIKKREDELNPKEIKLAEREAEIKKREDELKPKESTLAEREVETKKQLLDLDRKTRKFRLDLMASKDPIRINCKLIASMTGENTRVATKEKGGQAKLTAKNRWGFNPKDAKFHTIYQASAEPKDLCQSIVDLVENAIDGKNSCLISHDISGREHWTTMFGPGKGASDALVPSAITKIFKRSKELKALDYKVDVTVKFETTSSDESYISENVKNEQTVFELLKKHKGNIVQVDGSKDQFVQFFITTETDQETLTGTLILATVGSIPMIKECFRSVEPTIQLTRNISEVMSDGRCRSVLITHIHEDKVEETKNCLAMVEKISKKNKK